MAAKKDETATVDAPKKATAGKTAAKKEARSSPPLAASRTSATPCGPSA